LQQSTPYQQSLIYPNAALQQTTIDEKASHIHAKLQPYIRSSFAANNKQQNDKLTKSLA
jgi:hypothetical protein